MQIKAQWEKRDKKTKSVKDMEYSKRPNIHVIGVPEEERQRRGQKQYLNHGREFSNTD